MTVTDQEVESARSHLVAWLRYHLEAEELNQQDLAERLGVSKGLITQWLTATGTRGLPGFVSLLAIAKELRAPLDILISRRPPPLR